MVQDAKLPWSITPLFESRIKLDYDPRFDVTVDKLVSVTKKAYGNDLWLCFPHLGLIL